jgi:cytochrome c556
MKSFSSQTLIIATLLFAVVQGQAAPKDDLRDFMHAKLTHSQKVLEGLTSNDFDLIAKHAEQLTQVSQASNWQVLQTEDYIEQSREFRRASSAVRDAAKKKNLDGAALAYVDMTMKCVNCHKYVRGVRLAKLDK